MRHKRLKSNILRVYNYNPLRQKINQFVNDHNGTPFHEVEFNEIFSIVYKTDLFFFIAYIDDQIVGFCPVHEVKQGLVKNLYTSMRSYEIPYGGWIFDESKVALKTLMNGIKVKLNEHLEYSSNILQFDNFYMDDQFSIHKSVIINLNQSIEELLSNLKSKQRAKIRKAEKNGIIIEEIPFQNIDNFYALYTELNKKVGIKIGPKELYRRVLEYYAIRGQGVCLVAKYNNELISSMILIANRNFTIAWVAGRKINLPNNLYQNEILIWKSIMWAKEIGSRIYDLCGLDTEKLPHLARMKLSFSKEIVQFYTMWKHSLLYRALNKIQNQFY